MLFLCNYYTNRFTFKLYQLQHQAGKKKLVRITTVPMALQFLLPGQMQFMSQHGYDVLMVSADGKERAAVIKNEDCPHVIVHMTRQITPLQDLKCLWQLIKLFRKIRPHIVHSHTPKAGLLGMLAAYFCAVPVRIHTVAGLPMMVEKGLKFQLLKFIESVTYAAATQVWPNSNSLKKYIEELHITKSAKLSIVSKGSSNGINLNRFGEEWLDSSTLASVKTLMNYSPDFTYLLSIGRLVTDKGIAEIVQAFKLLNEKTPSLKLVLVGDFEEQLDPLPAAILNEIKSNESIKHIGWSNKVEYFMQLSDLFIFASHREGFPNVLLQAGAMKLPVLCSKIPGNIDIVTNNETGLIFEKGNSDEIITKVEYALQHMDQMHGMAEKLYQQVHENYQREVVWHKMLEKYETLLQ